MNIIQIGRKVLEIESKELQRAIEIIDENFEKAVRLCFETRGRIVVTGMGKSGIIGRKISATLTSTGSPSVFLHPAEALHGDIGIIRGDDTVLALSSSGETNELVFLLGFIRRINVKIIAITGNAQSTLARESDIAISFKIYQEACPTGMVPSTSTTLTLALGDALAIALMNIRDFTKEDFRYFHPGGYIGKKLLKVKHLMHNTEELPVVLEDSPMPEVIRIMDEKKFGLAVVVDRQKRVRGIITDGDLRRKVLDGIDFSNSSARDCMTENPRTISADRLCSEALQILEEKKITSLIVEEGRYLIGLIHLHDLWRTELI